MDIVNRIPYQIGSGVAGPGTARYILQDVAYNTAIGGVPFIAATADARPYIRELVDIRKEQFDNFAEPGEQSLQGWWLRSQSDFRGGAGILYQDPDTDNQFNVRFADSCGVNVWSAGEVYMLPSGDVTGGTQPTIGAPVYLESNGNAYWRFYTTQIQSVTAGGTVSTIGTVSSNILSTAASGLDYYASTATQVYKGTGIGAPAALWTTTLTTTSSIDFVKGRLMASFDNKVYELVGGTPPTLPAAKYTHPTATYKFNGFAEGPNAIYASGNDGTSGSIFKFTLDNTGTVPTLAGGVVAAQMPLGETINHIYSYIGTFVGISTNRGFRVAEIGQDGDLAYGPLLWEAESGRITGWDNFLFVCVNSTHAPDPLNRITPITSGLYRVDLGRTIQEQTTNAVRFAYAKDVFYDLTPGAASATLASDVITRSAGNVVVAYYDPAVLGNTVSYVIDNKLTSLGPNGWLETGRIRFNTEEPKLYKFGSIRAEEIQGNLDVYSQVPGDEFRLSVSYGELSGPKTGDFSLTSIPGSQNWLKLMFVFRPYVFPVFGPIMNGWQLKALPGSIRQRFITQAVLCFDKESDKTGQWSGYDGYCLDRLQVFEDIAQAGDSVILQDLSADVSTLVVIEGYQFVQGNPPGKDTDGFGGYLTMKLRTVGDTVTVPQ